MAIPEEKALAPKPVGLAKRLSRLGILGQLLSLAIVVVIFGVGSGGRFLGLDNILAIIGLAGIPALLCMGIHQVIIIGAMDMSLKASLRFAESRSACSYRTR